MSDVDTTVDMDDFVNQSDGNAQNDSRKNVWLSNRHTRAAWPAAAAAAAFGGGDSQRRNRRSAEGRDAPPASASSRRCRRSPGSSWTV